MADLVVCVPNFSEGRRPAVIAEIRAAIASAGVRILDTHQDASHNRSVLTFVGQPQATLEAAFAGAASAARLIDLRQHRGVHPRMGAVDVVPFVPFGGFPPAVRGHAGNPPAGSGASNLERCVELAHRLGRRIAAELEIPVYYYGAAARVPERRDLERVRRSGFEELREQIHTAARRPDEGPPQVHPSAGAVAVGARHPLVAYNVNLRTRDARVADAIARQIRASSGGLPGVKALGWWLEDRGMSQVSMNLTDYRVTGLWAAYRAVAGLAQARGVEVAGSEIVGTLPAEAVANLLRDALLASDFRVEQILEGNIQLSSSSAR